MYAPAIPRLHPWVLRGRAAWERATCPPNRLSTASRLWWQFHITKSGIKEIKNFTAPARGTPGRLQGTLGHNGIADCGGCLGFRRTIILHVAAFRLFLRGT